MTAEDIMTQDVVTIEDDATLGVALGTMEEQGIRHLPVVREGELVGIVTDRDLRGVGLSRVRDFESLEHLQTLLDRPVTAAMSGDLVTVDPSADVSEVVDLMLAENVSGIPVVAEDGTVVLGMVSWEDVLRALRDAAA